eukprot:Phypoly_transcript_17165.p1 GENE.Phypoly_transcript_17165~~Phypoly_transcript_17165.p1  ORF type:complete len:225 (+),score=68.19 Phypoly_transcript_17165:111-785(+)
MDNVDHVISNIKNEKENVKKDIQLLNLDLADVEREIELYKLKIKEAEAARAQKKQVREEIVAQIESCTQQFAKIKLQTQQLVQSTQRRQAALSNFKLSDRLDSPKMHEGRLGTANKGSRTLTHVPSKLEKTESFEIDKSEKNEKNEKTEKTEKNEKNEKNEKIEKIEKIDKLPKSNSEINAGMAKVVVPSSSKGNLVVKSDSKNEIPDEKGKKPRQKKGNTLDG